MVDKGTILNNVKGWIEMDDEIRELRCLIRHKRKEKKELTATLVATMKAHEVDCFELGEGNKLLYTKRKTKKALSKKHLLACLAQYLAGTPVEAAELGTYILDTRQEKIQENIRRKIKNKK